jgi:hypothetical protein
MSHDGETQYLGGRKAKIWTYLILFGLLVVGLVVANVVWKDPKLAKAGLDKFLGLPSWMFPLIGGAVGLLIFWLGLKVETDWPEALGALIMSGSLVAGEKLIGWNHFALGGLSVIPYVLPVLLFLVLLAIGMVKSR